MDHCSSCESNSNPNRKRKHSWDDESIHAQTASIELQLNEPLPLDWEQCLDLQSGRMYYMNRKSLKKSWRRPKEEKLDLDLNISTSPISEYVKPPVAHKLLTQQQEPSKSSRRSTMVAVVCYNCHLLVMLCSSSPSCPNCKFVHTLQPSSPRKNEPVKPLETLSLMH